MQRLGGSQTVNEPRILAIHGHVYVIGVQFADVCQLASANALAMGQSAEPAGAKRQVSPTG